MNPAEYLIALILGLVEGFTEFLPISSTGHLIVVGDLLGFHGAMVGTFEIFIQLGAVLAVVWHYRGMLVDTGRRAAGPEGRSLWLPLFVAFLPVAIVGLLVHDWIKAHLFTPMTVAVAMVAGGVIILLVERLRPVVRTEDATRVPLGTAFGVGLIQILSLVPGTSRSATTILGGYALGCSRRAATEFSFLLAIPVLGSATLYDLAKNLDLLTGEVLPLFAVGTVVSFITALVVIRIFLRFVSSHDFAPFAWYRIGFGLLLVWGYWGR